MEQVNNGDFQSLLDIIARLRGENGCPWDKKQTPRTMAVYLTEEMYELMEAIESDDIENVCEELGDVLFLVLLVAYMYQEKKQFAIVDVIENSARKMIRRHPHVFGEQRVHSADDVMRNWEKIKKTEKKAVAETSALDSIPPGLPGLMRAYKVTQRVAKAGFDWHDISEIIHKAEEEWKAFKSELILKEDSKSNEARIFEALGDMIFSIVNIARFLKIHPESALVAAVNKFEERFKFQEKSIIESGKTMESVSDKDIDELWQKAEKNVG